MICLFFCPDSFLSYTSLILEFCTLHSCFGSTSNFYFPCQPLAIFFPDLSAPYQYLFTGTSAWVHAKSCLIPWEKKGCKMPAPLCVLSVSVGYWPLSSVCLEMSAMTPSRHHLLAFCFVLLGILYSCLGCSFLGKGCWSSVNCFIVHIVHIYFKIKCK